MTHSFILRLLALSCVMVGNDWSCLMCGRTFNACERRRTWYVFQAPVNPFWAPSSLFNAKRELVRVQGYSLKNALCNEHGLMTNESPRRGPSIIGPPEDLWLWHSRQKALATLGFAGGACWVPVAMVNGAFVVRLERFNQLLHEHGMAHLLN